MAATRVGMTDRCLFEELASRFVSLGDGQSESGRQQINNLLDEMNAKVFKNFTLTNADAAVQVVSHCCALVSPRDSLLVAKGCQLMCSLVSRQQLQLPEGLLPVATVWCVRALRDCADIAVVDVLGALEPLLRAHNKHRPDVTEDLVQQLVHLLKGGWGVQLACEGDVQLAALQCLEAMVHGLEERWLDKVSAVFLEQLQVQPASQQDQLHLCKVVVCSLKGLLAAMSRSQSLLHLHLGVVLGCVKAYMLHGLPGHTLHAPQLMYPSLLAQPDCPSPPPPQQHHDRTNKGIRLRKGKARCPAGRRGTSASGGDGGEDRRPAPGASFRSFAREGDGPREDGGGGHWSSSSSAGGRTRTSDSDVSDAEGRQLVRLREAQAKVRHAALSLLLAVSKTCDKRTLFGYWPGLLPDGTPGTHARTLATCLLKDSSPHCRLAVADVLVSLLPGARTFLLHAHASDKQTAFTPFSVTVGNMVQELHRCLCLAVLAENSLQVLVALLRCLAALVQNTPYQHLPPALGPGVLSVARGLVQHRDAKVQVASLTVLGSLAALDHTTAEIQSSLLGPEGETARPWLLDLCLRYPRSPTCPVPVRVEALQLLAVLATNYLVRGVLASLQDTLNMLHHAVGDVDPTVCLHAARALEAVCMAMQRAARQPDCKVDEATLCLFWEGLLSGPLLLMLQNPDHAALRAVGCDCLSNLDESIFLRLPGETHTLVITLLLGCSRDEAHVRASAVRALSICVMFRPLREDVHFVLDTAEAVVSCLRDEALAVRMKASWSLANLTDALVLNKSEDSAEDAPESLLVQLVQCSITAAKDNDKVRCNAVRALGNVLQIARADSLLVSGSYQLLEEAVDTLVRNATAGGNMKVRWNSCYAMGNLLRNPDMYQPCCQERVLGALTQLVQDCRNLKVRTSAALSLSVPRLRAHYGGHYLSVWDAMLRGLGDSDCALAFSEYQHRDQLLHQLCLGVCHLATLLTSEDVVAVRDVVLAHHADSLQQYLTRLSLGAEHAQLEQASASCQALLELPGLSQEQLRAASLLAATFLCDT